MYLGIVSVSGRSDRGVEQSQGEQVAALVEIVGQEIRRGALEDQRAAVSAKNRRSRTIITRSASHGADAQNLGGAEPSVIQEKIRHSIVIRRGNDVGSETAVGNKAAIRADIRRVGCSVGARSWGRR
jgi:hypothetical protein